MTRIAGWVASLALAGVACGGQTTVGHRVVSAREAIDTIYRSMEGAFERGDADAIARIYTDDAEWYVPETPVVRGRGAIARAWKATIGTGGNRLRIDVAEVEEQADRAHEIGRFTISAPDGAVVGAGKYLVIWVREPDGQWKTRRDIYNWDIPPIQP